MRSGKPLKKYERYAIKDEIRELPPVPGWLCSADDSRQQA
jgi:hypothetical protein